MFGINRDRMGRFAASRKTWKFIGLMVVVGFIWFWVHMFFSLYTIQNTAGVHGIVAKATYNAQIDDHAKADEYDTMTVGKVLMGEQY